MALTMEDICQKKGGIFKKGEGCLIEEFTERQDGSIRARKDFYKNEGRRLYYETTQAECEKNGDEYVHFGEDFLTGIKACKEVGLSEYCDKNVNWKKVHTISAIGEEDRKKGWITSYIQQANACLDEIQLPEHKLVQSLTQDHDVVQTVIEKQKLPSHLINIVIKEKPEHYQVLFGVNGSRKRKGQPNQHLTSENIDTALDAISEKKNEYGLNELYSYHKLSQKQIAKAIGMSKELFTLYQHQTLNKSNIKLAIQSRHALESLFSHQKIASEQIDEIISEKYRIQGDVSLLYKYQSFNQQQINKIIKSGDYLHGLIENKKVRLNSIQINNILSLKNYSISRTDDLKALFRKYKLNDKQVDKSISEGKALDDLVRTQMLTDTQITRLIKTRDGYEIFELYSKKGALKPEHIDLALSVNLTYISALYENQKMTPDQITKALDGLIINGKNVHISREVLYASQKLNGEQVSKALEYEFSQQYNKNHKEQLFIHQSFFNYHVDYLVRKFKEQQDDETIRLFMQSKKNFLSEAYLTKIITIAKAKEHNDADETIVTMFDTQTINENIINHCIETDVSLENIYANYGALLTHANVEKAMAKGSHLEQLYRHAKMTDSQITAALMKETSPMTNNRNTHSLIQSEMNVMNEKHLKILIETGSEQDLEQLFQAYRQKNPSYIGTRAKELKDIHIERAIERGQALDVLYKNSKLSSTQIENAIKNGKELYHLYCNHENNFSNDHYRLAIQLNATLESLYSCQTPLPKDIVVLAINHGVALHELYEHQTLDNELITRAIERGVEVSQLLSYQKKNMTYKHLELMLKGNDEGTLYYIYDDETLSKLLTVEQRNELMAKITKDGMLLSPSSNVIFSGIKAQYWGKYIEKRNQSIAEKVKENPLEPLVGIYPLTSEDIWKDIKQIAEKNKRMLDETGKYAIAIDKPKDKIKLGKIIRSEILPGIKAKNPGKTTKELELEVEKHPLMWKYKDLMNRKVSPFHLEVAGLPQDELDQLEIVISNNPDDIAAKSTGHRIIGTSCETIDPAHPEQHYYGWDRWTKDQKEGRKSIRPGHGCGWCSDIEANNLIAFIRKKDEPDPRRKWVGRSMIRWCNRDDDKKPDAILERYYNDSSEISKKYYPVFTQAVLQIMKKNGFAAERGKNKCITPYPYTGYADYATHAGASSLQATYKQYNLGDRPMGETK